MSNPTPLRSSSDTHQPWRVILVGRTGLDQTLRRDPQIELIRCRDTIEAIGELGDPIDHESPEQAIVIVAPDAIEDSARERKQLINALRLIDPAVRVLIVGDHAGEFDASVQRNQSLGDLVDQIAASLDQSEPAPVTLRFIDPGQASQPETQPVTKPQRQTKPEPVPAVSDATGPERKPEVKVVVRNEDFEHRAQRTFEQQDDIHRSIILGDTSPSDFPATPVTAIPVVHDDEPVVHAMLKGRPIIEPAIAQINARLGRSDITLVQGDEPNASLGVPVIVGDKAVGILCCPDTAWLNTNGRLLLATHARWLSTWIRLEAQQSELRRCAFTDALTGAWNRRYFDRYLTAAIEQSRRARRSLSIMVFDIDSFKHYNDTYGHGAGDEILIETVKLLTSVIRPSDRVCRVGGDEFAVIFYEPEGPREAGSKPLESIYQIACRFQTQICQHRFPKLGTEALGTLTISGGLSSYPWDGHDGASLLESADRCAMESKRQGKNAITLGPGAESVCHLDR